MICSTLSGSSSHKVQIGLSDSVNGAGKFGMKYFAVSGVIVGLVDFLCMVSPYIVSQL